MKQPDLLIKAMQAGDESAFTKLYGMYSESLFGVISVILHDKELAEEALQDTFIKVWKNAASYNRSKGRFFTWLMNIARNTAIDKTRTKAHKNRKKNLSSENFVDILMSGDNLNTKTDSIGIMKFVDALKPVCIRILDLLFFKGYTHSDAAKELEIPLGTLKTRNRNCIKELRKSVLD